jgi:hypothetical protein
VQIDAAKDAKQERSKGPGEGNSRVSTFASFYAWVLGRVESD